MKPIIRIGAHLNNGQDTKVGIRFHYGRNRLSSGLSCHPSNWDKAKQRYKATEPDAAYWNTQLGDRISELRSIIEDIISENQREARYRGEDLAPVSWPEVVRRFNVAIGKSQTPYQVEPFFKKLLETDWKDRKTGTVKVYENAMGLFSKFVGGRKMTFADVDKAFYKDFTAYLRSEGRDDAYTHSMVKRIKQICRLAWDAGVNKNRASFEVRLNEDLSLPAPTPKPKPYLTLEEVKHVFDLELTDPKMIRARDCFVAACLTGLRESDWGKLSLSSRDLLEVNGFFFQIIRTQKGRKDDQTAAAPILSPVREILERNGGRLPFVTGLLSDIKELARLAGFDDEIPDAHDLVERHIEYLPRWTQVGTHTGRRSFVSNLKDLGAPNEVIKRMTGHAVRGGDILNTYDKRSLAKKLAATIPYLQDVETVFGATRQPILKIAK